MNRDDGILYYDCTNFFFEIEEEAGLKQYVVKCNAASNDLSHFLSFLSPLLSL